MVLILIFTVKLIRAFVDVLNSVCYSSEDIIAIENQPFQISRAEANGAVKKAVIAAMQALDNDSNDKISFEELERVIDPGYYQSFKVVLPSVNVSFLH